MTKALDFFENIWEEESSSVFSSTRMKTYQDLFADRDFEQVQNTDLLLNQKALYRSSLTDLSLTSSPKNNHRALRPKTVIVKVCPKQLEKANKEIPRVKNELIDIPEEPIPISPLNRHTSSLSCLNSLSPQNRGRIALQKMSPRVTFTKLC